MAPHHQQLKEGATGPSLSAWNQGTEPLVRHLQVVAVVVEVALADQLTCHHLRVGAEVVVEDHPTTRPKIRQLVAQVECQGSGEHSAAAP